MSSNELVLRPAEMTDLETLVRWDEEPHITNIDAQRFDRRVGFEDVGLRTFGLHDCLVMVLSRARLAESALLCPVPTAPEQRLIQF